MAKKKGQKKSFSPYVKYNKIPHKYSKEYRTWKMSVMGVFKQKESTSDRSNQDGTS